MLATATTDRVLTLITVGLAAITVALTLWNTLQARSAREEERDERTVRQLQRVADIVEGILADTAPGAVAALNMNSLAVRLQIAALGMIPNLPKISDTIQVLGAFNLPAQFREMVGPPPTIADLRNHCLLSLEEIGVQMNLLFNGLPQRIDLRKNLVKRTRLQRWKADRKRTKAAAPHVRILGEDNKVTR